MLTGYQCEVVAYIAECEFLCPGCAEREYTPFEVEQADLGLAADLSPVIRFSLDEVNGERVYEAAEERIRDFAEDHPAFASVVISNDPDKPWLSYTSAGYRLADKLAERLEDTYAEHCGSCGEVLG